MGSEYWNQKTNNELDLFQQTYTMGLKTSTSTHTHMYPAIQQHDLDISNLRHLISDKRLVRVPMYSIGMSLKVPV